MRFKDIRAVDLLWNTLVGLTVLFVVGKLGGAIDWPWWAVLSPLFVPLSLGWAIFLVLFLFWFSVILYHRLRKHLKDKA